MSGARAADASLDLSLDLADGPATRWHLKSPGYTLHLACTPPGLTVPTITEVAMDAITTIDGVSTAHIPNLPRGGSCEISDEMYTPASSTAAGQYGLARGAVSGPATGYSFTTEPAGALVLADNLDPAGKSASDASAETENLIEVTNHFTESSVNVTTNATGTAVDKLPADAVFTVDMKCSFGSIDETYGPFEIPVNGSKLVEGLPVGADCTPVESDHLGATEVTATLDGVDAALTANRSLPLTAIEKKPHEVVFTNRFDAGGNLTVLKRVEAPKASTVVGDVEFAVACTLGGHPLNLGDKATLKHTFTKGEREALLPIPGLPVDASCKVTETVTGGANIPAPERTATVLAGENVIVEMLNVFEPAALSMTKKVAGPGAGEKRVPKTFGIDARCVREVTVGGELLTVTDFSGVTQVAPGATATIADLPQGSLCTVTEPKLGGAESVKIESLTKGVKNESDDQTVAIVALAGPTADGTVVPTRVEVTNRFKATEGLKVTGSSSLLAIGAASLLVLAAGATLLTRRRKQG